jgi:hypothetical protein
MIDPRIAILDSRPRTLASRSHMQIKWVLTSAAIGIGGVNEFWESGEQRQGTARHATMIITMTISMSMTNPLYGVCGT